jgi:hypothetical protein
MNILQQQPLFIIFTKQMKKRAMLIGMAIAIAFQGLNPLQWM